MLAPFACASSLTSLFEEIDVASGVEGDPFEPSSNRPIAFMRSVRSSSLSRSTSPDPQIPSGGTRRSTPSRNVPSSLIDDVLDGAFESRHPARDRAPFERRTGRTRRGKDAVAIADDQLRVRADVHDRDEPVFVREIDGQHAGGGVGADVAADDRQPVDAGLRVNRQQAAPSRRQQARRGALALRHFDLGDRAVRVLADRVHALPEEQIAHRRVADHDDVVNGLRIGGRSCDRMAQVTGERPHQKAAGMFGVVVDSGHDVRAAEPLRILERRVCDELAGLEIDQTDDDGRGAEDRSRGRGSVRPTARSPRRSWHRRCDRRS